MSASSFGDTSMAVRQGQMARIAALTPAERLVRALALSELARRFAWAGAMRTVGTEEPTAARRRFLVQMYGAATADWVASRIAAERDL